MAGGNAPCLPRRWTAHPYRSANADERIAWVYHVDHALTEAENRAARRAIGVAYNDEPRVPFHQMVREEQRKMLQVVRDDESRTT